jgi:4-amino-4-deoxy-L-arabinose transferase-like glycosyltransferase
MQRREWSDVAIVAGVAALTNFTYCALSNGDFFFPDSFTYLRPAQNILRGLGFFAEPDAVETMRTPGYPLLLAAFGTNALPVIVLQHLLNVALCYGVYLVARRRVSRLAGLVAGLLLAFDTPTIHLANKILTETLFTAGLFALFVLALEGRQLFSAGALTGVLVLIRPLAIAYFAVLAAYFVLRRIRWPKVAMFVCVSLVLPIAWAARNAAQTGVFTVASISGANLLEYRAAGTLAIVDGGDFKKALARHQDELTARGDAEIIENEEVETVADVDHAVIARYYARIAWPIIRQHPFAFALLTGRGIAINLFDGDADAIVLVSRLPPLLVQAIVRMFTVALFVIASVGIAVLWRRDRPLALLIIMTVAYFILISAGGESEYRFRVPIMPECVIAAATGVGAMTRSGRLGRRGLKQVASATVPT